MPEIDELTQLLSQRAWDKELNLWIGSEPTLRAKLNGITATTIDLLDLLDGDVPKDDDDIRLLLRTAIRKYLQKLPREQGRRTILIVLSAALLARYGVGVREFYDWFCDDFSMAFLVIEAVCPDFAWPEDVECHPNQLVDYFSDNSSLIKRQFGA